MPNEVTQRCNAEKASLSPELLKTTELQLNGFGLLLFARLKSPLSLVFIHSGTKDFSAIESTLNL